MAHSPIGYATACGALSNEQAMQHPERNLISNYVGTSEMHITVGPIIELAPLDTLILCSDALPDNLYDEEICEHIRKGPFLESITELIADCQKNMLNMAPKRIRHPDDLTLISYKLGN